MNILIAEDDAVSRLILQKCVERLGHTCLLASSGMEAWSRFQHQPVDVVISDWMMPGMDGLELCRRVREWPSNTYTYFILLTSLDEKHHFISGMQAGADDYLTKPLDREELQMRLIAAARVTSLHRQLADQKAELERLNHQLYEEGRKDALTGLRNRLCMQEDLRMLQDRAERYGHSYCAALCDIDYYKRYNDHYGHLAGDAVLKRVGAALTASCRTGDTVYRYGGEEFLILLPEQPVLVAGSVMRRICESIRDLGEPHESSPFGTITISVGIASLTSRTGDSVDHLLKRADEALYHAKGSGRNCVAVYEDSSCSVI